MSFVGASKMEWRLQKINRKSGEFFFGCHSVLMDSFYFGGQIITANATSYTHILKNEKISNGRRKTKLSQTIMKYLFLWDLLSMFGWFSWLSPVCMWCRRRRRQCWWNPVIGSLSYACLRFTLYLSLSLSLCVSFYVHIWVRQLVSNSKSRSKERVFMLSGNSLT